MKMKAGEGWFVIGVTWAADKVIFGSDWPGMPYIKRNIEIIRDLPLNQETKEKILGGNAARILGLDSRR